MSVTSNLAWKPVNFRKENVRKKEPGVSVKKEIKVRATHFSLGSGYHWWLFQILCQSLQAPRRGRLLAKRILNSSSRVAGWKIWENIFICFSKAVLCSVKTREMTTTIFGISATFWQITFPEKILWLFKCFLEFLPHYRQQTYSPVTLKFGCIEFPVFWF